MCSWYCNSAKMTKRLRSWSNAVSVHVSDDKDVIILKLHFYAGLVLTFSLVKGTASITER